MPKNRGSSHSRNRGATITKNTGTRNRKEQATTSVMERSPAPIVRPKERPVVSGRQRIFTLALGDLLAFLAFAAIGLVNHSKADGLALIPNIVAVAAPFIAAWFIVAPTLGAFRDDLTTQPRKMVKRTLLAWICAWPVGLLLRWPLQGYASVGSLISFAIVVLFANGIFLLVWRWPYALTNSTKMQRP